MLQKSGRLVLWEAMFILELHSAETQVFFHFSHFPCAKKHAFPPQKTGITDMLFYFVIYFSYSNAVLILPGLP